LTEASTPGEPAAAISAKSRTAASQKRRIVERGKESSTEKTLCANGTHGAKKGGGGFCAGTDGKTEDGFVKVLSMTEGGGSLLGDEFDA